MTQPLFQINIMDDGSVRIDSNINNTSSHKIVDLQYFLQTFGQMFGSVETPLLPLNCRKLIKSANSELYIFEFPEKIRTITYCGNTYPDVMCPRMIFILKIGIDEDFKRRMVKGDIYSCDSFTPFNLDMRLNHCIFNNFLRGSGMQICWGGNSNILDSIVSNDPSTYASIFNLYMDSPFGTHWSGTYDKDLSSIALVDIPQNESDFGKLCLALTNQPRFPASILKPVDATISSIITKYNSGEY
jgi:hypothetical protein